MIIDFRLRPPIGESLSSALFTNPEVMSAKAQVRGMEHASSVFTRDPDETVQEMDAAGVEMGVFAARLGNDAMGEIGLEDVRLARKRYPDRFVGFASLGPDDVAAGPELIREWKADANFAGLSLEPGTWTQPLRLDDAALGPIYEACERARFPVMFTGGTAGPDPSYSSPLYIDHVASDFPDLVLIAAHGGWPYVHLALGVAYRRSNLYLLPDCYLFGMAGWRDFVDAAKGYMQDRFLYGSSYPVLPIGPSVEAFKALVPQHLHQKLMYDNAAHILGR